MLSIMLMATSLLELKGSFLVFLITSFVLVAGQSFLYSFVMEFIINRLFKSSILVVLTSSALGFIAALGIILLYLIAYPDTQELSNLATGYGVIGFVSGFISGSILRRHYNQEFDHEKTAQF